MWSSDRSMQTGSWSTDMRHIAAVVLAASLAVLAAEVPAREQLPSGRLSAEQILERNAAARGGAGAWRNVQTMIWTGHIESARVPVAGMRFVLDQKRPNKTRFEMDAMTVRTLRVFDGQEGWTLHPARDGREALQRFTSEELKFAQAGQGIDGPLIDHVAKGNVVSLDGMDDIDGRKTYRLQVRLLGGERDRVWVDAKTFLEVRYDRVTDGAVRPLPGRVVSLHYRDYRTFDGLKIPCIIETVSANGDSYERMVIEQVVLNSPLEDSLFARPSTVPGRHARRLQARQPELPETSRSAAP